MPMSRTARRLAVAAGCLASALVLIVLALPRLVSLEATRARVIAAAEAALHRKVEIGRMRLRLFPLGAGLDTVAVRNRAGFDTPALLSADRVFVDVAFWPLLSRRIEIRRIVLDGAAITLERSPSGALNVDDFLSAGQRESAPATQTAAAAALLVSRIDVERGKAAFVDRRVSPGQTVTLAVEDVAARLSDLGPATAARFEVSARLLTDNDRNLSLKGTLGPPPTTGPVGEAPLAAEFSAKGLALGRLAPYVAAFRSADPGTLSVDGKLSGKALGALSISGRIALEPPAAAKMPAVDGTLTATLDWPKGTLAIEKSLFDVAELPLSIEGRMDDLRGIMRTDLRIATPGDVGLDHVTGFPGVAGRFPQSLELSGRARLEILARGPAADLDLRGSVEAAPIRVVYAGRPLFEAATASASLESRGSAPITGRVAAPRGKLRNVAFQNLRADWTWHKGVLTLSPAAEVFGGTLGGRVETDVSHAGSESRLALEIHGVEAKTLVESATTPHDVVSGRIDGRIDLTSRGLSFEALSKTGRGDGRVSLSDADLRTVKLMPEVARALAVVGGVVGFAVPPSLESATFSTLQTSLVLADGRIATPDLEVSGRGVAVTAGGSIGLDRTLSYEGRVVLGPEVVQSLGTAGRYLSDSAGRITVPFHASGSLTAPNVSIDQSVVLELGRHALARIAREHLGGITGQTLGEILGGKAESPIDVLQQLLRAPNPTPTPTPRPR
jgi:AsmA family/AsmA-like C-terminal region